MLNSHENIKCKNRWIKLPCVSRDKIWDCQINIAAKELKQHAPGTISST